MWREDMGLADPVPLGGPCGLLRMGALGAAGRQRPAGLGGDCCGPAG